MKKIRNTLIIILFAVLTFPYIGSTQDFVGTELSYDVYRNYPPISITKDQLNEAETLTDLNKNYEASWVKEYISVEIMTSNKGNTKKALSKNSTLSHEQIHNIKTADLGSDISVMVKYIPDNTLKNNDIKEINFTFTVDPENEAKFAGGQEQLRQYLKDNVIDKIAEGSFKQYQLAAVKFSIDEEGHVIDPHLFWPTEDEKIDDLLLKSICEMPNWESASYTNGTKVKQDFVLAVGDMKSCVVNLLNIRQDLE